MTQPVPHNEHCKVGVRRRRGDDRAPNRRGPVLREVLENSHVVHGRGDVDMGVRFCSIVLGHAEIRQRCQPRLRIPPARGNRSVHEIRAHDLDRLYLGLINDVGLAPALVADCRQVMGTRRCIQA